MDISNKLGPLPPIPAKPLPLQLSQATNPINDSLRFPAIEQPNEGGSLRNIQQNKQPPEHATGFEPASDRLQRSNPSVSQQDMITRERAADLYQSSAANTAQPAQVDQIV